MACLSLKMIGRKSLDEVAKKNAQIEHEPVFIDSMNPSENICENNERIEKYEAKIFQSLNKHFDRNYVYIKNKSLKIWTLSFNKQSTNTPIVFVHGACCSIGLWALNIANISDTNPIYAFDTLGFGRSDRPKFSRDPVVIENQFIDSIEDWRREMGLEKVILIGHSFGGYLSTSYALKYAQHVLALVLVDPWGFSEKKPPDEIPISLRAYAKCGRYFTPASFFRKFGRFGLSIFKSFYSPEIKSKFEPLLGQNNTIYKYIYYSNNKKPSGEHGFRLITDNLLYAKYPMMTRIHELNPKLPIWFIYGKNTWIDIIDGNSIKERRADGSVSTTIIDDAGHEPFFEQPEKFNSILREILKSIETNFKTECLDN